MLLYYITNYFSQTLNLSKRAQAQWDLSTHFQFTWWTRVELSKKAKCLIKFTDSNI